MPFYSKFFIIANESEVEMEEGKIVEYKNDDITILWKPSICIHAGECVKTLPKVYNPKERPWIKIENASTLELKDQIAKCPSKALSYCDNEDI